MPFSHLYGKLADLRNFLFDRGILRSYALGARTISIGNITTGGTGKTPLVAYTTRLLSERGERVCILTRGYGRKNAGTRVVVSDGQNIVTDPDTAGDEPVELALGLGPSAMIIADADRVAAAEWARREYGISAFILDDGFQHRRARRDVDIVCIDATNPWGGGKTLPGGRLRESLENLSRADIVVITRADLVDKIGDLISEIAKLNEKAAIFSASMKIDSIVNLYEFLATNGEKNTVQGPAKSSFTDVIDASKADGHEGKMRFLAFCGLGNPESFFLQLRKETSADQVELPSPISFPDHHHYVQSEIGDMEDRARDENVDAFVTTAKDAVKLRGLKFTIPCYVIQVGVLLDRPDDFAGLL